MQGADRHKRYFRTVLFLILFCCCCFLVIFGPSIGMRRLYVVKEKLREVLADGVLLYERILE